MINLNTNTTNTIILLLTIGSLALMSFLSFNSNVHNFPKEKPKIAFTFDDGSIQDMPNYKLEEYNLLIMYNFK